MVGGGVMLIDAVLSCESTTISKNQAMQSGGGIAVYGSFSDLLSVTMPSVCVLEANTAVGQGGAVYAETTAVNLTQFSLTGNTAREGGIIILTHTYLPLPFSL